MLTKPIRMLLKVLYNNVLLEDGTVVKIVKRDYPYDHTPCLTIDNSGGTSTIQKNIINKDSVIPEDHPQYDSEHPDRMISQQMIREERSISLNLNIWCNSQDEREEIINQISTIFKKIQSDHYSFCKQYHNGNCSFLDSECRALTVQNGRTAKHQCPDPMGYHYENIFTTYDIIRPSFDVEPAYDLDDSTVNPQVLRSIIRVSFSYYDYHIIGGPISQDLSVDEELL